MQLPSGTCVPQKHKFAVSSGSEWVHSGFRLIGSDSPVNELLSTHMFGEHSNTLISAGTKSPCSNFTMSPIVIKAASTKLTSPPRTTVTLGGLRASRCPKRPKIHKETTLMEVRWTR